MLGDGIRRNIATVSKEERDRFRDAIVKLQSGDFNVPGDGLLRYSDGRTVWEKQEWIHWAAHTLAHAGPAFYGWHREICNRFEAALRAVDPDLSLHYWDWTTDPRDQVDSDGNHFSLFTPDFLGDDGSSGIWTVGSEGAATNPDGGGEAGPPFANFPTIIAGKTDYPELTLVPGLTPPTQPPTGNLADRPSHKLLWRAVGPAGVPATNTNPVAIAAPKTGILANPGGPSIVSLADADQGKGVALDSDLLTAADGATCLTDGTAIGTFFPTGSSVGSPDSFKCFGAAVAGSHMYVHQYMSGTEGTEHVATGDPFFFLIHANLDRILASWQRAVVGGVPQSWRLDPERMFGTDNSNITQSFPPWDGTGGLLLAPTGHPPNPLKPWVTGNTADNAVKDGMIDSVSGVIPNHQIVTKTALDPTVINPASYDTAVHAAYIIANRDTFSNSEVTVLGNPATFANAIYVVYDGFTPKELGVTTTPLPAVPPTLPTFSFVGATKISAVNPSAIYENPSGTIDMPQRIMISYDLRFTDASDFSGLTSGGQKLVNMKASLNYNVDTGTGGSTVNLTAIATTELLLVDQPNPYMVDTEPGDPSPFWLSVDTRVFQVKQGDTIGSGPAGPNGPANQGDLDTDSNAPFTFIQQVIKNFNSLPNDNSHPFKTQLTEDESGSQLELSQKVSNQRVYNYAVAKVRYLAPGGVDATGVSVFFRVFSTAVSGLDYDATSGNTGNYRRTGDTNASSAPLLGIENDSLGQPETASIPFFAEARHADMTGQTDATNVQTIGGNGSENVAYFGCWLDLNLAPGDPHFTQFPLGPTGVTNWPNGPFSGTLSSIQQLMLGTHHCMTAEIFFWPPGVGSDPIPHEAGPSSSDRLAQRNLVLVKSGNPGYPATHTIQHTFLVKPAIATTDQRTTVGVVQTTGTVPDAGAGGMDMGGMDMGGMDMGGMDMGPEPAKPGKTAKAAAKTKETKTRRETAALQPAEVAEPASFVSPRLRGGPNELIVRWNNVPRASVATFYFPELEVDQILALSAQRQHPKVLEKTDAHTFRCRLSDVTFIPLPPLKGNLAGLVTLTLPNDVKTGEVYRFAVEQYDGSRLKSMGAFQVTIPVARDEEILPEEIRKLAVMRYVQQAIPASSRWTSIFKRYVDQIAARVRGFGGNPDEVKPAPDGGEGEAKPPVCHPSHKKAEICPTDLFCMNIPWKECDLEGEIDLKLRFRKKCD